MDNPTLPPAGNADKAVVKFRGQKRPRSHDPEVKQVAAAKLAPKIADWLQEPLDDSSIADLAKMRWPMDGYEFARELERNWNISPNYELVEILECSWGILSSTRDQAVADWVKANNITLTLAVGSRVTTKDEGPGEITARDEKKATYCVRPDSELEKFELGGGYILTPEEVTAIPAAVGDPDHVASGRERA